MKLSIFVISFIYLLIISISLFINSINFLLTSLV